MRNAASLAAHDVIVPTKSRMVDADLFHFRAALDLLGQDWGGAPGHAAGSWDTMVRRVRRAEGTVIISHEILAPAPPDKVAQVMRDLAGSEIHIVYSARDLGRQLPAAWQESIKQGRKWSFRRFLDRVEKGGSWFHKAFDLPTVLTTWGTNLPPERVHVVTVPPSAAAPAVTLGGAARSDELWLRFCRVFDIDPAWAPLDSERTNRSLGIAETQLIRQLNRRMGREVRRDQRYDVLVRDLLAHDQLARRSSTPVRLHPRRFPWAEEQAERWIEWIEGSGVDVVGDVADLRPVRPAEDAIWSNPDRVGARRQLEVALDALETMTREAANRPDPDRALGQRIRAQAKKLRST
ncbi:hypothetical protein GCM10027026_19020 [Myroides odoratimimus subsp. xuanwuensis]